MTNFSFKFVDLYVNFILPYFNINNRIESFDQILNYNYL